MNMTQNKPANPHLTAAREMEIAELAEFLAEDRFPGKRIEPTAIAKSVDIGVILGHYDNKFDGMLEHDSGRFFIYCNLDRVERVDSPRARFTLAHELGHYYIPEHHNALASGKVLKHPSHCDFESKNPIELEADHFASCLLMPSERFRKRAKKLARGLESIRQLSGEFGTSLTSAAIRYAKLDLLKCVIIKWNIDGYGWKWLSPSAYAEGWRKTIEEPASLLPGSATEKNLSGRVVGQSIVRSGTTAGHWFPFISIGSHRDCLLSEESISLGKFGALTLLSPAE